MSAKSATHSPQVPASRHSRKRTLSLSLGSVAVAMGLSLVLAGASSSDVSTLSDALGTPVETMPLPAYG